VTRITNVRLQPLNNDGSVHVHLLTLNKFRSKVVEKLFQEFMGCFPWIDWINNTNMRCYCELLLMME
jgi:hypothetical protein